MLLQCVSLVAVPLLPQDCSEIAHCHEAIEMLLAELAARQREDASRNYSDFDFYVARGFSRGFSRARAGRRSPEGSRYSEFENTLGPGTRSEVEGEK